MEETRGGGWEAGNKGTPGSTLCPVCWVFPFLVSWSVVSVCVWLRERRETLAPEQGELGSKTGQQPRTLLPGAAWGSMCSVHTGVGSAALDLPLSTTMVSLGASSAV